MTDPRFAMQSDVEVTVSHPKLRQRDWEKGSGMGGSHTTTKKRSKARGPKHVLNGDYAMENITTETMVIPSIDSSFLAELARGETYEGTVVQFKFYNKDGTTNGEPLNFLGCNLEKWSLGDADANGEDAFMVTCEWAVGDQS